MSVYNCGGLVAPALAVQCRRPRWYSALAFTSFVLADYSQGAFLSSGAFCRHSAPGDFRYAPPYR